MAKKKSVMCCCPLQQHRLLPVSESCCGRGEASRASLLQPLLQCSPGAMPVA